MPEGLNPEQDPATQEAILSDNEFVEDLATEFDLLFPVVPAEDDPYPPDEGGDAQLLSDLEEQSAEEPDLPEEPDLDYRQEPAFDWTTGEFFRTTTGDVLMVTGVEAIIEWCQTCINTPKGVYVIFDPDFGTDLQQLLGESLSEPVLYSEAARTVEEGLERHPRISSVEIESVSKGSVVADTQDSLLIDLAIYVDDEATGAIPLQFTV
jgi:phage baseplate assembly protein W